MIPGRQRSDLVEAGLKPSEILEHEDYFIVRLSDPDGNALLLASARLE